MKIGNSIIQSRNIIVNTADNFECRYKGKDIHITTEHAHGKSIQNGYYRYSIVVFGDRGYDVNTYEDLSSINQAIKYALLSAKLL